MKKTIIKTLLIVFLFLITFGWAFIPEDVLFVNYHDNVKTPFGNIILTVSGLCLGFFAGMGIFHEVNNLMRD
jgi:hypothetical protein